MKFPEELVASIEEAIGADVEGGAAQVKYEWNTPAIRTLESVDSATGEFISRMLLQSKKRTM